MTTETVPEEPPTTHAWYDEGHAFGLDPFVRIALSIQAAALAEARKRRPDLVAIASTDLIEPYLCGMDISADSPLEVRARRAVAETIARDMDTVAGPWLKRVCLDAGVTRWDDFIEAAVVPNALIFRARAATPADGDSRGTPHPT